MDLSLSSRGLVSPENNTPGSVPCLLCVSGTLLGIRYYGKFHLRQSPPSKTGGLTIRGDLNNLISSSHKQLFYRRECDTGSYTLSVKLNRLPCDLRLPMERDLWSNHRATRSLWVIIVQLNFVIKQFFNNKCDGDRKSWRKWKIKLFLLA